MRNWIFSLALFATPAALAQEDASSTPVLTAADLDAALAAVDPAAENTVIEFGTAEAVVLVTASGEHTIMAELAVTPEQQQRGLMWRDSLAEDAGMLFLYDLRRPSMWMRNTLIPLDIVFIREDGEIAKIIMNAQPGSLQSLYADYDVTGVLELAGGQALALGLRPGDQVRHAAFETLDAEPLEDVADVPGEGEADEAAEETAESDAG